MGGRWSVLPTQRSVEPWGFFGADHPLSFTVAECEKLVAVADDMKMRNGLVGATDTDSAGVLSLETRKVQVADVDWESAPWAYEKIMQAVLQANIDWWGFDLTHLDALEVLKYRRGGKYVQHTDWGTAGSSTRKVSASVQLSDPSSYKGGDLTMITTSEPAVCPREQGSIVLFPSWTLHRVNPIISGTRRAAVAWVQGPPYR